MIVDRWYPAGGWHPREPPEPGTLLAYERRLYRVHAVHERHTANWDPEALDRLHREQEWLGSPRSRTTDFRRGWDGRAETWPDRPRGIAVDPDGEGKREHWKWPHRMWRVRIYALPDHYPVCSECGQLYPCRELDAERQAAREMANVEKLMSIPPGACWHCREPVSSRQGAIAFPGENLLLPGAPPPVFHQRRTGGCRAAATAYEKRWAEAGGARDARLFEEGTTR